jgi:hypothetical protein
MVSCTSLMEGIGNSPVLAAYTRERRRVIVPRLNSRYEPFCQLSKPSGTTSSPLGKLDSTSISAITESADLQVRTGNLSM